MAIFNLDYINSLNESANDEDMEYVQEGKLVDKFKEIEKNHLKKQIDRNHIALDRNQEKEENLYNQDYNVNETHKAAKKLDEDRKRLMDKNKRWLEKYRQLDPNGYAYAECAREAAIREACEYMIEMLSDLEED